MLRLASITSTGLGAVQYTYDTYGKLTKIARGTTEYKLTYDTWSRPVSTKVGTTALSTNTYDSYGKLLTVTYANGFAARYEYDDLDRVKKIYQTENNTESLVYEMIYNGEGDLYEIRNYRTGRASFFDYDHAGRCMASRERSFTVSGSTISYGNVISSYAYKYDECNNLTKLTCSVAGSAWSTVYTYDGDNRPKTTTLSSGKAITNTYDAIGRLSSRKIGLSSNYITSLTYVPGSSANKTTALVSTYQNGSDSAYSYTYDDNGNITEITQGTTSITYAYDAANRLTRENNQVTNETVTYEYDTWGNILNKKIYAYTTGDLTGLTCTQIDYAYTNTAWGDQLTSYDNAAITYDSMGNPTSYRGYTFGWRGKQLTSASDGTDTLSFEYNEDGLRQKKTVNNVDTDYFYNGSVLIGMQQNTDTLLFSYDASGSVVSVKYNGTEYYYLRNAQGDIVGLIDNTGAVKVQYTYNTWGKKVNVTGALASTLGTLQPFRYRGYVYDEETGFYYLQSRYYDPEAGRFISADVLLSTGQGVLGHNAFAYCLDNPVRYKDSQGTEAEISWEDGDEDTILLCVLGSYLNFCTQIDNKEHAFVIYKKKGLYYVSSKINGQHSKINYDDIRKYKNIVAVIHSHPYCQCHYASITRFSEDDIKAIWSEKYDLYLASPNGNLYKFDRELAQFDSTQGVEVDTIKYSIIVSDKLIKSHYMYPALGGGGGLVRKEKQ